MPESENCLKQFRYHRSTRMLRMQMMQVNKVRIEMQMIKVEEFP